MKLQCFFKCIILMLLGGCSIQKQNNLPTLPINNSTWKIIYIEFINGTEIKKNVFPETPEFLVSFNLRRMTKEEYIGSINIQADLDPNSKYYCNVKKGAGFYIPIDRTDKYKFRWNLYDFGNNRIDRSELYLPLEVAFNSSGNYELKNDTIIFYNYQYLSQELKSKMYMIKN